MRDQSSTWADRVCGVAMRAGVVLWLCTAAGVAQSVPEERPRIRPASALAGWADWEKGKEIFSRVQVPPAPVLSPEQALATFRLAPGYRLELFAAEPMVANPIFFEFDPDGRLWAIEYRGYMRDLAGTGEGDPICRIVVLEDADADGRADRSTVFLDGLVMPRTFAFVSGGVLVAEPPRLWFCEDRDGDLRCEAKREVGRYGVGGNPQHTANGLRYGLDNWLHNSDWPKRHRFSEGRLIEEETIHRGQFGGSFDDFGRFFTCYESSALHADLLPVEYLLRNPGLARLLHVRGGPRGEKRFGAAVNIAREAQEVFPIRPTPQITLGGLELREDGRLRTYTVVSGSCIYDGHQFPPDAYGNAFIPEAGGHLIGRLEIKGSVDLTARRVYTAEEEFLACTDERFRPVNARVGPDGALYLADMYHGIIEHVIFLVPWLTEQVKARNLESGNDMGRIWRVVAADPPIDRRAPRLSQDSPEQLVRWLSHPNGWHRRTAQRLLVERGGPAAVPALVALSKSSLPVRESNASNAPVPSRAPDTNALGRLHALWTLDGLKALDWDSLRPRLTDPNELVRATAARLAERFATRADRAALAPVIIDALGIALSDPSDLVRLHAVLALGGFSGGRKEALLAQSLRAAPPLFQTAVVTGLAERELDFLEQLLKPSAPAGNSSVDPEVLSLLAQIVFVQGRAAQLARLLDLTEAQFQSAPRQGEALLDGVLQGAPPDLARWRPLELAARPSLLVRLTVASSPALVQKGYRLNQLITWPGDTTLRAAAIDAQPLDQAELELVENGQQVYATLCAPCHQPHGGGLASVAPPLNASDWISGPPERLARIVLHGLYGPITVNGQDWHHHMPGFGASALTNDTDVAAVLSYVRRAWGNTASPVTPALISQVRGATQGRELPWTAAELTATAPGATPAFSRQEVIQPAALGVLELPARLARTYGRRLKYNPTLDILAPWVEENDVAEWLVEITPPGTYEVRVTLGADAASAQDQFVVETSAGRLRGTVPDTGGNDQLREHAVGSVRLSSGPQRILMRPDGPLRRELADVRSLRLVLMEPGP